VPWIKKILQRIYDRFEDVFLLGEPTTPSGHGKRGPEKKKYVINYVRTNPQELRPFEPRGVPEARKRTRKRAPGAEKSRSAQAQRLAEDAES
jgi:hypothetical protein